MVKNIVAVSILKIPTTPFERGNAILGFNPYAIVIPFITVRLNRIAHHNIRKSERLFLKYGLLFAAFIFLLTAISSCTDNKESPPPQTVQGGNNTDRSETMGGAGATDGGFQYDSGLRYDASQIEERGRLDVVDNGTDRNESQHADSGGIDSVDSGAKMEASRSDANWGEDSSQLDSSDAHDGSESFETTTIDGIVDGNIFNPVSVISGISTNYFFVFMALNTEHIAVAISEFSDDCGNQNIVGRGIVFDLFQNPSLPNSIVTEPGVFTVWFPSLAPSNDPIPTDNRVIVTYANNAADGSGTGFIAQSGNLTVTKVSSDSISGTFDVAFEDGHLTGSFSAPICEPWTHGSSIP